MGLITSLLGYVSLIFTPFPGLQQISFFSIVGLLSAYIVVTLFFPRFYRAKPLFARPFLLNFSTKLLSVFQNKISFKKSYYVFLILIILSAGSFYRIVFDDNVRLLYSSPKSLIDKEILTNKILQQNKSLQFFLIQANTP